MTSRATSSTCATRCRGRDVPLRRPRDTHYRGYRTGPDGEEVLVGLGFFDVDFARDVRGYNGEILDAGGHGPERRAAQYQTWCTTTSRSATSSIDLSEFIEQFRGKTMLAR